MSRQLKSEVATEGTVSKYHDPMFGVPSEAPPVTEHGTDLHSYNADAHPPVTGYSYEPAPLNTDGTQAMWSSEFGWVDPEVYVGDPEDLFDHPEDAPQPKPLQQVKQDLDDLHEADDDDGVDDHHLTEGASLGEEAEDIVEVLSESPLADDLGELISGDREAIEALDDAQLGLRSGDLDHMIDKIEEVLDQSNEDARATYISMREAALESLGDYIGEARAQGLFAWADKDANARALSIDFALGRISGDDMEAAYLDWWDSTFGDQSTSQSAGSSKTNKHKYRK